MTGIRWLFTPGFGWPRPRALPLWTAGALLVGASVVPGQVGKPSLETVARLADADRFAAAADMLDRLPKAEQGTDVGIRLRFWTWKGLGEAERVMVEGEKFLAGHPGDLPVQLWVGEAFLDLAAAETRDELRALGFRERAVQWARTAVAQAPNDARAVELLVAALVNVGEKDEALALANARAQATPTAEWLVVQARALQWTDHLGDGVGILAGLAHTLPNDGRPLLEKSLFHLGADQLDECVRSLEQAVLRPELSPFDQRRAGDLVAHLIDVRGQGARVIPILDRWTERHPDHGAAQWWRGYFLERGGKTEAAVPCYEAAWRHGGLRFPEAAYHLGILLGLRGEEKRALELVRQSLELQPALDRSTMPPADAFSALAKQYVDAGNWERAVTVLSVGAPFLTRDWRLQQNLGFCLREWGSQQQAAKKSSLARKSWKQSAEHYELAVAALEADPQVEAVQRAQVINDTGLMYHYHLQQIDRGVALYERAVSADPQYVDALENLGVAMLQKKRWKDATGWFDRVLAIQPQRSTSLKGRQTAQEQLERRKTSVPK